MSNGVSHLHQNDDDYTTMGSHLTWTKKQTDISMGVLKFKGSAKSVTRALNDANVFSEGHFPSSSQINAMIAYCRSILIKRIDIFDTHERRKNCREIRGS